MTRAAAIVLGGLAASFVATARPPDAVASVLCQVRKKALVVRDQCKAREELLTPDRQAELGLVGPRGPVGAPGPSTGGLRVIDAVGRDVGVVTRTGSYYGATAQIVGQLTLPGRSEPQFVIGEVDGNGLSADFSCRNSAIFYETSTCRDRRMPIAGSAIARPSRGRSSRNRSAMKARPPDASSATPSETSRRASSFARGSPVKRCCS